MSDAPLHAGACALEITPPISPEGGPFLWGYPNVPRYATGVHDPLYTSALCLREEGRSVIFIANDIIFVSREQTAAIRREIEAATGVPGSSILISVTHTHSGPATVAYLSNQADPVVPPLDEAYLRWFCGQVVQAAIQAHAALRPAEVGWAEVDVPEVGTNRHDPAGPALPQTPVMLVREPGGGAPIACMLVNAMHATVLHEDSTLISGDFPGLARPHIQAGLGKACPVLHHVGPSGNLSPRHVVKAQTFAEAERLGGLLAQAVLRACGSMSFRSSLTLRVAQRLLLLTLREMPDVASAERMRAEAGAAFAEARARAEAEPEGTPAHSRLRAGQRTAECAVFGAEETLALARAAQDGRLQAAAEACLPAEIQAIALGPWRIVAWMGEFFVEYGLELRTHYPGLAIITMANGELQGYIVTEQAVAQRTYEAGNALFDHRNGPRFVSESLALLAELDAAGAEPAR